LPRPILNTLPSEVIFFSNNAQQCIEAYQKLPEPQKTLLDWLLDLLRETASYEKDNKMNPTNLGNRTTERIITSFKQIIRKLIRILKHLNPFVSLHFLKLAIVVAPNLYDSSTADPMEGLVLSQKCVQFLIHVLRWRMGESDLYLSFQYFILETRSFLNQNRTFFF
jgi:hypothetical protein